MSTGLNRLIILSSKNGIDPNLARTQMYMRKLLLFFAMLMVGVCFVSAKQWTVRMETTVHIKWVNTESPYNELDKGAKTGPTREFTVEAPTESDALTKAKSICYDACDGTWTAMDVVQENGHTYRVYKKIVLGSYKVVK